MRRTLWLFAIIVLIAGCSLDAVSPPTAEVFNASAQPYKVVDVEAFREGRTLAVTRCAQCHRFFFPKEFSPEEWIRIFFYTARLGG